jgi:TolB-like protein
VRARLSLFAVLVVSASPARAAIPGQKESVVVLPLRSDAIKKRALDALNQMLPHRLAELAPLDVVTTADINAQLTRERMKDALACDDARCAADLAGALGARYLATGRVTKLASDVIVSLSLIDTKTQKTARGQAQGQDSEALFAQLLDGAVRALLDKAGLQPPSSPASTRPMAFIALQWRFLDHEPTHTWNKTTAFGGAGEEHLSMLLADEGYGVLQFITPAIAAALYPNGQAAPDLGALKRWSVATLALVGEARCDKVDSKMFGTNLKSSRCAVVLKAIDVATGESKGSVEGDGGSMALDFETAGYNAFKETVRNMWPDVQALIALRAPAK